MDYVTWQKLNEASFPLGIKSPGTFFINQADRGKEMQPSENDDLSDRIKQSNLESKQQQADAFDNSFDAYVPFEEKPRLGTPEYEEYFARSIGLGGDNPSQRFADGISVGEDVLVAAPTEDEVMPLVKSEELPASRWDDGWLNWEREFYKTNGATES